MDKIKYIEKINELITDINFDTATKRLFNDYITFEHSNKIFQLINKVKRKTPDTIIPEKVEQICAGIDDDTKAQNLCYKYTKKHSKLEYLYLEYGKPDFKYKNIAYIPTPDNFVRQFLNIASVFGIQFVEDKPKNPKKYHFSISLSDGKYYNLTYNNSASISHFTTLANRYFSYNLDIFHSKILKNKTIEKLDKLANKTSLSQKIYKITKDIFDDFDFIYAIMAYLQTIKSQKLFNLCIDKDESYLNHNHMNTILNYINTASSIKRYGYPPKIVFIQDIAEKMQQTRTGKDLYNKLTNIYQDKLEIA